MLTATIAAAALAAAAALGACEPEPPARLPRCERPDTPAWECPPDPPTNQVWATVLGHVEAFGTGPRPTFLRDGRLAVIYGLDSVTYLHYVDPADGTLLESKRLAIPPELGVGGVQSELTASLFQSFGDTVVMRASNADYFLGVDLAAGEVIWHTSKARYTGGSFAYDRERDDYVYVGRDRGARRNRVHRMDWRTGELSEPLIDEAFPDDTTYVNYDRNWASAVPFTTPEGHAAVGLVEWEDRWNDPIERRSDYRLLAYDLVTGRRLWTRDSITEGFAPAGRLPVYHGGLVYQNTWDSLRAYDPATGEHAWVKHVGYDVSFSDGTQGSIAASQRTRLVVDPVGGRIYQGGMNSVLQSYSLASGYVHYRVDNETNWDWIDLVTDYREWPRGHVSGGVAPTRVAGGPVDLIAWARSDGTVALARASTGAYVGPIDPATAGGRMEDTGLLYDAELRRFYLWDGYRVFCEELREDL